MFPLSFNYYFTLFLLAFGFMQPLSFFEKRLFGFFFKEFLIKDFFLIKIFFNIFKVKKFYVLTPSYLEMGSNLNKVDRVHTTKHGFQFEILWKHLSVETVNFSSFTALNYRRFSPSNPPPPKCTLPPYPRVNDY